MKKRGSIFAAFVVIAVMVFMFIISAYFTVEDKKNVPDAIAVEKFTGKTQMISKRVTTKNKKGKYNECIVPIYRVINEKYPKDHIRVSDDDFTSEESEEEMYESA